MNIVFFDDIIILVSCIFIYKICIPKPIEIRIGCEDRVTVQVEKHMHIIR